MMTRELFAKTLVILLLSAPVYAQESPLLSCFEKEYEGYFNFYKELDKLEQTLLDKGIIEGSSAIDYQLLTEQLNEDHSFLDIGSLSVTHYIPSSPFKGCIADHKSSAELDKTIKYMFLLTMYIDLARQKVKINIEVDDQGQIWLNSKETAIDDLTEKLKKKASQLQKSGVPEHEIEVAMKVADNVKMGFIVDIQTSMREAQIWKITYFAPEKGH